MTLTSIFDRIVEQTPDAIAIRYLNGSIDYRTLQEATLRLSNGLQSIGVRNNDRITIILPNIPHFIIAYYAILRLGAIVVPINPQLKPSEIVTLLEECKPSALITVLNFYKDNYQQLIAISNIKNVLVLGDTNEKGLINLTRLMSKSPPNIDELEINENETAVINFTPGRTSYPKGVELTHNNLISNALTCSDIFEITPDDILLTALPLHTVIGQTLLMNIALLKGASLFLFPKFDPNEIVSHICQGESTVFVGTPMMFKTLLNITDDNLQIQKPLKLCICGNGHLEETTLKDFENRFKTYILECYTTVETSPVIAVNKYQKIRNIGSLGHPIPSVDVKVIDGRGRELLNGMLGEIIIKGPNVMKGYLNNAISTVNELKDGWFYTGDLGFTNDDGFLYFVDRIYEKIIKGGFTIYPYEIEKILKQHPSVLETTVVSIPDPIYRNDVKAYVVLKPNSKISSEELISYCKEHLPLYKVPKTITFCKELPRKDDGLINREELKKNLKF